MQKKTLPTNVEEKKKILRREYERLPMDTDKEIFADILNRYEGTSLRSLKSYKKQGRWFSRHQEAKRLQEREARKEKKAQKKRKKPKARDKNRSAYLKQRKRKQRRTSEQLDKKLISEQEKMTVEERNKTLPPQWQVHKSDDPRDHNNKTDPNRPREDLENTVYNLILFGTSEPELYRFLQTKYKLSASQTLDLVDAVKERFRNAGVVDIQFEANRARLRLEYLFKRAITDKQDYRALLIMREINDLLQIKSAAARQESQLEMLLSSLSSDELLAIENGDFSALQKYTEESATGTP